MCPLEVAIAIMLSKQTLYRGLAGSKYKQVVQLARSYLVVLPYTFNIMHSGTLIAPKCLCQKDEKWTQCRVFQEKWSSSFLFTEVNGKPVFGVLTACLILHNYAIFLPVRPTWE